jgi:hypothetical protein
MSGFIAMLNLQKRVKSLGCTLQSLQPGSWRTVYVVVEMLVKGVLLYAGRSMKIQAAKTKSASGVAKRTRGVSKGILKT